MVFGPYEEIPPKEKLSEYERLLFIEKEIRGLREKNMEGDLTGIHLSAGIKVLPEDWLDFTEKGDELLDLSPAEHKEFIRLEEAMLRGELTEEETARLLLWKERFDAMQKH